ncbi:DUF7255 family protein [Xanthovirga aplysinae]|uniref:DUF7255 family protein n=1 Tax=Xanthovirga aplysinae TaxID=2529853 RepID=UPI0012BCFCDC|nr:hypothetical protein [Xanthovirga aplysinae]MTI31272.1 hypothetical protein [Xanthovirga aplysinae]
MNHSRKEYFGEILQSEGFSFEKDATDLLTIARLKKWKAFDLSMQVYKDLSGIKNNLPIKDLNWDFKLNQTVVLLDNSSHFNRYRSITLRSSLYPQIKSFPLEPYRRYCRKYEKECLKSAIRVGLWANPEAEEYFGKPAEAGDFFGNGSPGWKLTAINAFFQDLAAFHYGYQLIRISVHDELFSENKLQRLEKLFESRNEKSKELLTKYLHRRLTEVKA